jgi:hypothetical protein
VVKVEQAGSLQIALRKGFKEYYLACFAGVRAENQQHSQDFVPALGHIEQGLLVGTLQAAKVLDQFGHFAGAGVD